MHAFAAIISSRNLRLPDAGGQLSEVVHFIGPVEEAHEIPLLVPQKTDDIFWLKALGLFAGIGLNPPLQIFTAPGPQAVAASRIPDKAERRKHHEDDTSRALTLWPER